MSTPPSERPLNSTESHAPAPSAADAPSVLAQGGTVPQVGPSGPALAAGASIQVPGYEIQGELGRGGMGVVYLAKNVLMNRPEVLKVANRALLDRMPGAAERFLREIRAAAMLGHENVVKAYSALQVGELLVFAMEYIEGEDLAKLVRRQGPLPVAHACHYISQAAMGLQHAHEQKLVHRDIKPHNLILSRRGKKHIVKVLDFGLAKAKREGEPVADLTGEGAMMGTPAYMAPEQAQDAASADIRADIYSLGCTLYFLLTGAPPFTGKSHFAILQAHLSAKAAPLSQVRTEAPAELEAAAAKMMAKDPAQRYQTPIEAARALAPFVQAGTPAAKAGLSIPVARPVAKKGPKTWRIAAGVGGVLLLAMVAIGLWAGGVFRGKTAEGNPVAGPTTLPPPPAGSAPADKPAGPKEPPRPAEPPRAKAPFDATETKRLQQACADSLGVPVVREVDLGGGVVLRLVLIPPGSFQMGSPDSDKLASDNEKPRHPVTITKPFYLGMYPVTQEEYVCVTGLKNPSSFSKGGLHEKDVQGLDTVKFPVERVSWNDAAAFCEALNQKDLKRTAGWKYALPTEAQWEYACRAGTETVYFFGDSPNQLSDYAWYYSNSGDRTHEVGTRKPNPWGLYDMAGNIFQWCADYYDKDYYKNINIKDPQNIEKAWGDTRVFRGGSCLHAPLNCRAAYRLWGAPGSRNGFNFGMRVCFRPD